MQKIQEELVQKVAGILSMNPENMDVNTPLHSMGLDSMRMVELIVFVEKNYGVDLMATGLRREDVASISALACTVEKRRDS